MKNSKKPDNNHRIRYTRKILKESLIDLMKECSITKIGIKDICALAKVSRSTFYSHYEGVWDLLADIEEEMFSYFEDTSVQWGVTVKCGDLNFVTMFEKQLQYIADSGNVLKILLSENGSSSFQEKFFKMFMEHSQKVLQNESIVPDDVHIYEGYAAFYVTGSIGLLQYWLKNNMHIPIPKLARMYENLIVKKI